MSTGVIYILTNPSFPEYVKIGYADDLNNRLKSLNRNECIPFAFRVYAYYEVKERLKDIAIHNMIDKINPNLRAIETFDGKKRKKEFYAMSAEDAYEILKTISTLSGTSGRLHKTTPEGHEIVDEIIAEEVEKNFTYSEDTHINKACSSIQELYYRIRESITSLEGVTVESKKLYVAFKAPKNIVDIEIQKFALKITINMKKGTLKDPYNKTKDVSNIGHWGNGDYIIYLRDDADFDYVLNLIMQSYSVNKQ
ncbi:MAG: GIY-YIG nuclease family protein [Clostridia bacterium]|nr:GIY-YIG nuclease family protein [Clostridia bacterium]